MKNRLTVRRVREGQGPEEIAQSAGIPLKKLLDDNGLTPGDSLVPGQELVLLFPEKTLTVEEGDSLYSLAKENGTTVRAFLRDNPSLRGNPLLYPGQTLAVPPPKGEGRGILVNGYAYPFIERPTLDAFLPYLTYLTVFTYGFTEEGALISPEGAGELTEAARRAGAGSLLLLSTLGEDGNFNNEAASRLFEDEGAQNRLFEELLAALEREGYSGVEVDFEFLGRENAAPYRRFLGRLKEALGEQYLLFAALAPKTSDSQPGALYEGHDYRAIGEVADFVLLMTYEWGYRYGPPMAVAPADKVEEVVSYAVTRIPPEKILLGLPNYGYDWPLPFVKGETEAESLSVEGALDRARETGAVIEFDPVSQAPYFHYREGETEHTVWFESAGSAEAKLKLVEDFGLAGVSVWNIMKANQALCQTLNGREEIADP